MSSLKFTSPLILISILSGFLLQTVFGANPLFHFCSNSGNFTANDPYETNLNKLTAGYLYTQAPVTGFGTGSVGETPNKAYGLVLCRGDVSSSDCKTCVAQAGSEIRQRCPNNKGGVIWYDNCLFKYSDQDFFGQIDNVNRVYMSKILLVPEPEDFNEKTKELLTKLAKEAYFTPTLYAVGETDPIVTISGSLNKQKLYGLVQCTRDLSSSLCKECLDGIIGQLSRCCDAKEGGRVVGASCNFRYEIYPFVNDGKK